MADEKKTVKPSGSESELKELLWDMPIDLDSAINKAAEHLPKGYKVSIHVEHAGYTVDLEHPDGSTSENVDGGDGIRSDINEGICVANEFGA